MRNGDPTRPTPADTAPVPLVLAGGRGSRLGGTKALQRLAGRTFLERLAAAYRASPFAPPLVVLGCDAEAVAREAERLGLHPIVNPRWESGQTSSLLAGLRALEDPERGWLVHPVDHALTTAADLVALARAFESHPDPRRAILRPRHGTDGWGHPVLYGPAYRAAFLGLGDRPAREIYRAHLERVVAVPVDNPTIRWDIDSPADLACAEEWLQRKGEDA